MKFSTRWIKHLKEDQHKQEFMTSLLAAKPVLTRLGQLLEEDIKTSQSGSLTKDKYESPNWAYLQADKVGEQRALNKILKMINIQETPS